MDVEFKKHSINHGKFQLLFLESDIKDSGHLTKNFTDYVLLRLLSNFAYQKKENTISHSERRMMMSSGQKSFARVKHRLSVGELFNQQMKRSLGMKTDFVQQRKNGLKNTVIAKIKGG